MTRAEAMSVLEKRMERVRAYGIEIGATMAPFYRVNISFSTAPGPESLELMEAISVLANPNRREDPPA